MLRQHNLSVFGYWGNSSIKHKETEVFYHLHIRQTGKLTVWVMVSVMSMRGPNNVGRAVQMDPTLLRYASAITEQKKCRELLAERFDRFQTLRNNTQQHKVKRFELAFERA